MKTIVTVCFRCEVCGRDWPKKVQALQCEGSPLPVLAIGDIILWRGRRSGGHLQTLVVDQVASVNQTISKGVLGHPPTYHLQHEHSVQERSICDPRSGYLNVEGSLGYAALDTRRVEVAMRDDPNSQQECVSLVDWLISVGVPIHHRIGTLYQALRRLEYELTWTRTLPSVAARREQRIVFALSPAQSEVLSYLSRLPRREECLIFLGGLARRDATGGEPHAGLDGVFDSNRYLTWGGVVNYSLVGAFDLLVRAPEEGLVQAVLSYRERLLTGEAFYIRQETLRVLFPIDDERAHGKWSPNMLRLAKQFGVRGSGPRRLRQLYEGAIAHKEKKSMPENDTDFLKLWAAQDVFAIMSGKGGVGKSTVTADLARALTARGKKIQIVDLDFTGPSQPHFFPVEDPRPRTRNGKIVPHLVDGVQVISMGHLLQKDEPLMWRGPYLEQLLHLFGTSVEVDADVILLDMPPGTGDIYQAVLHLCPHAFFVIVATSGEIALADVRRAITALSGEQRSRIAGLIENMAYRDFPQPVGRVKFWGEPNDVPDLARSFHVRYLGALPIAERDKRLDAMQSGVLPAILDCLRGKRFLEITSSAITAEVNRFLQEHTSDQQILQLTWGLDNLAGHLEAWVTRLGGDHSDPRYHDHFRRELRRLWRKVGTCLLTRQAEVSSERWWAPVVEELREADLEQSSTKQRKPNE